MRCRLEPPRPARLPEVAPSGMMPGGSGELGDQEPVISRYKRSWSACQNRTCERLSHAPGDRLAAWQLPEPRPGRDDDAEPAAADVQPSTRTSTPVSSSRHSCHRSSVMHDPSHGSQVRSRPAAISMSGGVRTLTTTAWAGAALHDHCRGQAAGGRMPGRTGADTVHVSGRPGGRGGRHLCDRFASSKATVLPRNSRRRRQLNHVGAVGRDRPGAARPVEELARAAG